MALADDVVTTIAAFALFADLTSPQLEEIAHIFDEVWFAEGERILRQGLSGSGFYLILEGTAAIHVNGVNRSALRAGAYFGELSCLHGQRPVTDSVAAPAQRCLTLHAAPPEGLPPPPPPSASHAARAPLAA